VTTVGISGTRTPSLDQIKAIRQAILELPTDYKLVSGGCQGIDTEAVIAARDFHREIHSVIPADQRRVTQGAIDLSTSVEYMPPNSSMRDRNTRVVALSDWLIAVPENPSNGIDRGSGTWMTVRIAKRAKKLVRVLEVW
jgi:predicted Rossmann fold nucleotide-binding protein DprA/Smf involved in DNA uptake